MGDLGYLGFDLGYPHRISSNGELVNGLTVIIDCLVTSSSKRSNWQSGALIIFPPFLPMDERPDYSAFAGISRFLRSSMCLASLIQRIDFSIHILPGV